MPAQSADPGKEIKIGGLGRAEIPGWQWTHPSDLTAIRGELQPSRPIHLTAMALTALVPRRVPRGSSSGAQLGVDQTMSPNHGRG